MGVKTAAKPVDAAAPPAERGHHGVVEIVERMVDPDGRAVRAWRCVDTLELMERNGTITRAQRLAGNAFHQHFRMAALDGLQAAALDRVPGAGINATDPLGNERSRRRVGEAIRILGGQGSVAASCAWHVLGLEWSLREWAAKRLCSNHRMATGVMVATLNVLEPEFSA